MAKTNKPINSTGRNWVIARKIVQYLSLAAFVLFFVMSRRDGGWSASLVNIPMRLDPLNVLAHLISSRTFLAGSTLALITVILTLVFGRAWCGWICPLGTTLDLISLEKARGKRKPPAENWRKVKYILLIAILTVALFGNLTLLTFDPLTLFFRTLTTAIWPVTDRAILFLENLLFCIPFLSEPVASFDTFIRPAILPAAPAFFKDAFLFGLLFAGVIALNLFAERFWCRYLCPLGGLLGWISKVAIFRRSVGEECPGCVLCDKACPTGTIDPANHYASDPAECTMCMDCLETCPRTSITFNPKMPATLVQPYDPSRREFLVTVGASAAALVLAKSGMLSRREPPFLVRPPGVREANQDVISLDKCIRCSECIRACPTNAIQPGVLESGVEGFGAPLIIPHLGYCDYSCNACGQVCPTQAIPPLSLEQKQLSIIGKAYINQNRCIPWADGKPCIVCEEMCPLPEKAVVLLERNSLGELTSADATSNGIKLPYVNRELCIGCGLCEYKCPLNGEAAIRVYSPTISAF
jgi:polyferredoxin